MKVSDKLANNVTTFGETMLDLYRRGGWVVCREATTQEIKDRKYQAVVAEGSVLSGPDLAFVQLSLDDEIDDNCRLFTMSEEAWTRMKNNLWMNKIRETDK